MRQTHPISKPKWEKMQFFSKMVWWEIYVKVTKRCSPKKIGGFLYSSSGTQICEWIVWAKDKYSLHSSFNYYFMNGNINNKCHNSLEKKPSELFAWDSCVSNLFLSWWQNLTVKQTGRFLSNFIQLYSHFLNTIHLQSVSVISLISIPDKSTKEQFSSPYHLWKSRIFPILVLKLGEFV